MGNISSGPIYKSFQMDFRFLSFNLVLWKDTMEEILEFVLREASLAMFLIYLSWITDVWKNTQHMKNMWEKKG